jgi:hypothetical protein
MIVIDSISVAKDGRVRQPVSSRIQKLLERVGRRAAGPLFWLGLPLLALVPLLLE